MEELDLKIPTLLIPLLPLTGFLILAFWGNRLGRRSVASLATSAVLGSLILGLVLLFGTLGTTGGVRFEYWKWIAGQEFEVPFALQVDRLSIVMILAIGLVATLVHIHAFRALTKDKGHARYFARLNLLTAAMLLLVLADNFLLMYAGWEGVAVGTYLLIGYNSEDKLSGLAARRAFVFNRIGDTALLAGIIALAASPLAIEPGGIGRGFTYDFILGNVTRLMTGDPESALEAVPLLTIVTLLFLFGALAKSSQLPLSTWLADSTHGPITTDALIQTVTTVVAGVYLVARMHVLFLLAPATLATMCVIGILTALYGATVALAGADIRRMLAYSTISQVGFMFVALGVGAFVAAIFHLVMHALFKACLILTAGSVIENAGGERNIRRLGGLKHHMPKLRWVFLIGTAALAGFPFMSGFFSLNTILHEALFLPLGNGWSRFAGILGYGTVFLTTAYAYRLFYKIFEGESRGIEEIRQDKSRSVKGAVLWILAGLSIVAGFIGIPAQGWNLIGRYLSAGVFAENLRAALGFWGMSGEPSLHTIFMAIFTLMFIGGFWTSRNNHLTRPEDSKTLKIRYQGIYRLLWDEYRLDKLYRAMFIRPGTWLCGLLWRWMDEEWIDREVGEIESKERAHPHSLAAVMLSETKMTYALYVLLGIILVVWLAGL